MIVLIILHCSINQDSCQRERAYFFVEVHGFFGVKILVFAIFPPQTCKIASLTLSGLRIRTRARAILCCACRNVWFTRACVFTNYEQLLLLTRVLLRAALCRFGMPILCLAAKNRRKKTDFGKPKSQVCLLAKANKQTLPRQRA